MNRWRGIAGLRGQARLSWATSDDVWTRRATTCRAVSVNGRRLGAHSRFAMLRRMARVLLHPPWKPGPQEPVHDSAPCACHHEIRFARLEVRAIEGRHTA